MILGEGAVDPRFENLFAICNCKQIGHNRGTCKNQSYVVEGAKRKRGRPRKIPVSVTLSLLTHFHLIRSHFLMFGLSNISA